MFKSYREKLNFTDCKWKLPTGVISAIESLKKGFQASENSKKFPMVSSTLAVLCFLFPINVPKAALSNPLSFLRQNIMENHCVPRLEQQKKKKPVVMFDFNNFLSCDRFSLTRFDLITYKRYFCEEFLFNIAHYYELVNVSDCAPATGQRIIGFIDPLGCIGYQVFLKDKRKFDGAHLNREQNQLIVISTSENEFHNDFDQNLIRIPKFLGNQKHIDSDLAGLMHFFINLHYMNVKDVRSILQSYRGCSFIESFGDVQKKLFRQRNLLNWNSYEKKLKEIDKNKIEEYRNLKQKINPNTSSQFRYQDFIIGIAKNIFL